MELDVDTGSGPAGFSSLQPLPELFFRTDPVLQGWDPETDAVALAAAMINVARSDCVNLDEVDKHLAWGPRRLNPAADYLAAHGYVNPSRNVGSAPYTYANALLSHRTRRLAQTAFG